jgi:cysteine desulfurase
VSAIYLDYDASTPIDPAVQDVVRPLLEGAYGNPSSGHWVSAGAKAALETARALGRWTTLDEIDQAVEHLRRALS